MQIISNLPTLSPLPFRIVLADTDLPDMDNSLAMTLRDRCGMELELMPQTLGLLFDLDTPADILVLGPALLPAAGAGCS